MTRLIMTLGLPGSGKTTWALRQQAEDLKAGDGGMVLVAKDELRLMLHAGRYSPANEDQVVAVRDAVVSDTLGRGRDVIVHDTNLDPVHRLRLESIAAAHGAEFVVQDFTWVPLDTCIARDESRPRPVGAEVIRNMWQQFVADPPPPPPTPPPTPL